MPININKASENTGTGVRYTGIILLRPFIVNPSKDQLKAMGIEVEEEPKYVTSKEEDGKTVHTARFTFYMKGKIGEEDKIFSHSIFLKSQYVFSKDKTKCLIIDKFGKSFYANVQEVKSKTFESKYMDIASCVACLEGQDGLINFVRAMASSVKADVVTIDNLSPEGNKSNLFRPDGSGATELKGIVDQIAKIDNAIKVLLFVKTAEDGKSYQEIYPYEIGRAFADNTYFHKNLVKMYNNNPNYFNGKDFGPIDFGSEKINNEQYRLRVWEEGGASSSGQGSESEKMPSEIGDNGFPKDWESPAPKANDLLDDPFA